MPTDAARQWYSWSTASNVFEQSELVRPKTRQRVER